MKKKNHKGLRKNPSAVIAFVLLTLSMFLFPLFNSSFFGETLSNKRETMFNLISSILSNFNQYFYNSEGMLSISLAFLFSLSVLLYFLNGFGLVFNRYSRYASYLTFAYLIAGLVIYNNLLNQTTFSLFGFEMTSISFGSGIYFVPIVGLLYFLFHRQVNWKVH